MALAVQRQISLGDTACSEGIVTAPWGTVPDACARRRRRSDSGVCSGIRSAPNATCAAAGVALTATPPPDLLQVLASQKQLENKYKQAQATADDWYRRAQLALQKVGWAGCARFSP